MNTKEKIITSSLTLFNSKGLENITTRHIASDIGISQGNLHYHYPNKNELIRFLFSAFITEIKAAEQFKDVSFQGEKFILSIESNFKIMKKYAFIFKDKDIIGRRLPELQTELIEFLAYKKSKFIELLNLYQQNQVLKQSVSKDQILFLADQFILTISTWLIGSEFVTNKNEQVSYFISYTARLIIPYLTEEEASIWGSFIKSA